MDKNRTEKICPLFYAGWLANSDRRKEQIETGVYCHDQCAWRREEGCVIQVLFGAVKGK